MAAIDLSSATCVCAGASLTYCQRYARMMTAREQAICKGCAGEVSQKQRSAYVRAWLVANPSNLNYSPLSETKKSWVVRTLLSNVWTKETKTDAVRLLRGMLEAFRLFGFEPLLFYGSLLGAQRDGKIIPWDGDMDVTVDISRNWSDVAALLTKNGFSVFRGGYCAFDRISFSKYPKNQHGWHWPWVDVYPYRVEGPDVRFCHQSGKVFYSAASQAVFPIEWTAIEGVDVATVANPKYHLSRIYPGWETHCETPKVDHRRAVANKKLYRLRLEELKGR